MILDRDVYTIDTRSESLKLFNKAEATSVTATDCKVIQQAQGLMCCPASCNHCEADGLGVSATSGVTCSMTDWELTKCATPPITRTC
jgi:hypothetical protein